MTNSQFATRLSLLNVPSPASSAAKSSERARRPLVSIALFGGMLALSAVPLLRYLKQNKISIGGGVLLLQAAKRRLRDGDELLAATRAEFERDRTALRARD